MKLIIVDDSKEYMALVRRMLAREIPDIEVTEYDPEQQGRPGADFDWSIYDALLLDYRLGPHDDGIQWLRDYKNEPGFPAAVLMTAQGDEYVAVQAIKLGAFDFIKKTDIDPARLAEILTSAMMERTKLQPDATWPRSPTLDRDASIFEEVGYSSNEPPDGKGIGYRFVRLIGQGASSRVYLAERRHDRMTLVLKIIDVTMIGEAQVLQRFVKEAEIITDLDSPFVVRFLEHGFTKQYGYIAMEFFTRGDLKQRIEHGVSAEDAINYARHIAYGLQAIHERGIVHRDLKPGNVMFRSDDSLALADFGISKRLDETSELTNLGSVLGTPNYISPEQALGGDIDGRSDLYSLGIILFEMLTGEKAFKAETATAVVYQHVHAPIPYLPDVLAIYQPLIDSLLAKRPEDRFSCAGDIIAALDSMEGLTSTAG